MSDTTAALPSDTPPPCDQELFDKGISVGLFDIPKWTAEALCKGIAAATGARIDWHYIAGRVHVKALPAPAPPPEQAVAPADDSIQLCISDLQHSAIYDNHAEMQKCIRAVCDRINALTSPASTPTNYRADAHIADCYDEKCHGCAARAQDGGAA